MARCSRLAASLIPQRRSIAWNEPPCASQRERRRGKTRPVHLPVFYGKIGDSYLVIASKGGAPKHPSWYLNILADPDVEVQVGTAKMQAKARTATGEERARLWQTALGFWPPYADYQKKTEREIPVVVLDPVR